MKKSMWSTGAAVTCVGLLTIGGVAIWSGAPGGGGGGAQAVAATAMPAAISPADGSASDLPCDPNAVPQVTDDTDARVQELIANNPASNRSDKTTSRDEALEIARGFSTSDEKTRQVGDPAVAVAAEVSYLNAQEALGSDVPEGSIIAAERCVWMVTVRDSFEPRSAPFGVDRSGFRYDEYTVVLDASSGEFIQVSAGPDSPSLLGG